MSQYTVQSSNPHLNLARTTSAPPEKNLAEFSQIKELSSKLQTNDNSGFTTNAAEKQPKKLALNPHAKVFDPSHKGEPVIVNPVPAPPSYLPSNLDGQVITQEKKKEITEKMESKMKKSLKINPNAVAFKPSPSPVIPEDLLNLTVPPLAPNWEKPIAAAAPAIAPNWEKPIAAAPAVKKEDPPKKKLQNTKNNEFQPSQPIEKEVPEEKKNVATSPVPPVELTPQIPLTIEPVEVPAEKKEEEVKPTIEEVKPIVEEEKPVQIEEPKPAEPLAIKKSIIIDIIKMSRKRTEPVPPYLKEIFSREVVVETPQKTNIKSQKPYQNKQISNIQPKPSPIKEPPADNNDFVRAPIDPFKEALKGKTNEWTQKMAGKKDDPRVLLEISVRSIFNKLTPENFDVLKKGVIEIARKGKEECDVVITLLIRKAWTELKYAKTYAEMCYFLQADKNLAYETKDGKPTKNYFKSKLFDIIQEEFEGREKAEKEEGKKKLTPDEKKKQILGNVKFIGELYLQKVIPKKIIHICICSMLSKYQEEYYRFFLEGKEDYKNYEYHLDGVIALFDKVGKEFDKKIKDDNEKQKENELNKENEKKNLITYQKEMKELNKDVNNFSEKKIMRIDPENLLSLDGIFEMLAFIKDCLAVSKIKHLLENLFERKASGWKETFFANEGPQKIKDLHNLLEKEQEEINRRATEFSEKEYMNESKMRSAKKEMIYVPKSTTPVFQVAGESKTQQIREERKDSPKNASAPKMKLNFNLNRNKEEKVYEKKETKLNKHEVEKKVKSIFKKMENHYEELEEGKRAPYDDNQALTEFISLAQKSNHNELLHRFLHDYYDIKNTSESSVLINNRINVLFKLVSEGHIPKDIFLKEFSLHLSRLWSFISDYPCLNKAVAEMFFLFSKADLLKYDEIEIDWTGGVEENSEDNVDDIIFVLKDFVEDSYKLLKQNGLESKKEENLKSLVGKIKDCSPEWFEKMKKNAD